MATFIGISIGGRSFARMIGAGAAALSAVGAGRYLHAMAQDATPAAAVFDPVACYQSFPIHNR